MNLSKSRFLLMNRTEGMTLISAQASTEMKNESGSMQLSISIEGNLLHIVRKLSITNTYVPIEKYDTFKSMINTWNNKKYREIVLKKGN